MPTPTPVPSPAPPSRAIRVFISSTFRDMQAERNELLKFVFPELRKRCEARGVGWSEVDLRWGITDEAQGEVLSICLEEIHKCRPYFLGILGERYGWVADDLPQEVMETHPWVAEDRLRSVTELEILHGVLNNPNMTGQAFFYFRSPAFLETLPPQSVGEYRESPSPGEIEHLGAKAAERRADERRRRLAQLKDRIRAGGLPVREDFADARALGELVLADLGRVIDEQFPPGSEPDPLQRQAADHEGFARSRAQVYIGRPGAFDALDAHVQHEGPPLIVVGESGLGKSALLSNWALGYRELHPEDFVLMHFVGATPHSTDWAAMLRRLLAELARRFNLELALPVQPEALRAAFAQGLGLAAEKGRTVLIVDGLDQLEDRDGARELAWLPAELPPNIRLIASSLPGPSLEEVRRRAFAELEVQPLTADERGRLIVEYLAQFAKALSPARVERIAAAPQTANPLFLRAMLEELRLFGVHERLDERLAHYLSAESIPDLYQRILERYESDYDRQRAGLVRQAMCWLWAARRGLHEAELLDLLGDPGARLPGALWSPLYLAAEGSLVSRSGLIGFFHDYLRRAVEARYLPSDEEQCAAHRNLAAYFDGRDPGVRRLEELPWQLSRAHDWPALAATLGDPEFLVQAWDRDEFEVQAYWGEIERNTDRHIPDAYQTVLDDPLQHPNVVWRLAPLLSQAGYPTQALSLYEPLIDECRRTGDERQLALSLGNAAAIRMALGDPVRALRDMEEEAAICERLGDPRGHARSLHNQANVLHIQGELTRAEAMYRQLEGVWRLLEDRVSLALSLGNRANVLRERGDLDEALSLYREKEQICRETGQHIELGNALDGQAAVLVTRGQPRQALELLEKEEALLREHGNRSFLPTCLGNQGIARLELGDGAGAMRLFRQQEELCRQLGDRKGLAEALGRLGPIKAASGDVSGAMLDYDQVEAISRELGLKGELQACLGNRAMILRARGDLDGAMRLHQEKAELCRELGNRKSLGIALGNIANILAQRGDLRAALDLQRQKEAIDRDLGNIAGLAHGLGNQANILEDLGDAEGALDRLVEQEALLRQLGNPEKLSRSLVAASSVLIKSLGRRQDALPKLEEARQLARTAGAGQLADQVDQIIRLAEGSND
jgi:tetratricopeptide (TPR) repeat protein